MNIKKILFVFFAILSIGNALAIDQIGIAYRYNGKKQRTPLGGVYIKVATSPNGVVSQEQNGQFVLKLKDIKMGDAIGNAIVQKTGMMVFNKEEVNRWHVQKGALVLIVCDANEFQKQKAQLITIGRNQAEKKYKQKLEQLKAQNAKQQLSLDQYYAKLDSIEKERNNALAHMEEYADMFARIDESEVDTLAQRAIELFSQGQLEESIKMFEQGNYLKKLDDALKVKAQGEDLRQKADSAVTLANKDIDEYTKSIQAQIAAYKMKNEWDKAGELLKGLADKLQTLNAIGDYACFAQSQNKFSEAEKEYELYIKKILSNTNPQVYEANLATSYNNLAVLYHATQRLNEAEQMHKTALEIRKRLADSNPQVYEPDLATSYNNLANLYSDTQCYAESEQMNKAALEIRKCLAISNPQVYEPDLANSYNNLAVLYRETQRYAKSEQMNKATLEILKRLAISNPQVYEPNLAASYNNLANLYRETQRYAESEQMYKAALEILKRLADSNPQAYEPDLANSYNNLANLYSDTQRYAESEQMNKAALEIRKRLVYSNLQVHELDLANSYNNLAILYSATKRFAESEKMYKTALEICKRMATSNPQAYEPFLIMIYNNLAILYKNTQCFNEAELMYKTALEIYKHLTNADTQIYNKEQAECLFWLADSRIKQKKYSEAIVPLEEALGFYKKEAELGAAKDFYSTIILWLNQLYSQERQYSQAYQCFKQNMPTLRTLYQSDKSYYTELLNGILVDQSFYSIFEKQYAEAEAYSKEALEVDSTKHIAYSNLAAALLFQGKYQEAENIYRQYKSELKEGFFSDFEEFTKAGVIPKNREEEVEKIKRMLNE